MQLPDVPRLCQYRGAIESALRYTPGGFTFADIEAGVLSGRMQFWPGVHAAIVTEIQDYPQARALVFLLAGGGTAREMAAMVPGITAWAKTQHCTQAHFLGRRGWQRLFPGKTGWKQTLWFFEKDL